jgi:predicted HTH transcriptional regulator
VSFFDDRIEVESPGILLPGMTVEDMRQGVSKIRNHVIARVFRELNLIEQWGSGVRRIFTEAQELGLPEPVFEEVGMRLRVVVYLAEALPLARPTEQVIEQVTEQVSRLVAILQGGALGVREAMEALKLKHRPTFLTNYLRPALHAGLVEMTQPLSPKSPTQKYRVTKPANHTGREIETFRPGNTQALVS